MEILKKIFCIKQNILFKGNKASYSQYCEDLFVIRFFNYKKIKYLDIGCNNPDIHNNTKKIYDEFKGNGINIDANPDLIKIFNEKRKNDLNLNIGIGQSGILPFYVSTRDTLSSFSNDVKDKLDIKEIINIEVVELGNIFEKFNIDTNLDFLSIDVEGWNLEVLKSNDWNIFRPKLICIENDDSGYKELDNFMEINGYKKIAYNGLNNFYSY